MYRSNFNKECFWICTCGKKQETLPDYKNKSRYAPFCCDCGRGKDIDGNVVVYWADYKSLRNYDVHFETPLAGLARCFCGGTPVLTAYGERRNYGFGYTVVCSSCEFKRPLDDDYRDEDFCNPRETWDEAMSYAHGGQEVDLRAILIRNKTNLHSRSDDTPLIPSPPMVFWPEYEPKDEEKDELKKKVDLLETEVSQLQNKTTRLEEQVETLTQEKAELVEEVKRKKIVGKIPRRIIRQRGRG